MNFGVSRNAPAAASEPSKRRAACIALAEKDIWQQDADVSRHLAKHLGGQINVQSAPGQGSTFTVTIPAAVVPIAPLPILCEEQIVS